MLVLVKHLQKLLQKQMNYLFFLVLAHAFDKNSYLRRSQGQIIGCREAMSRRTTSICISGSAAATRDSPMNRSFTALMPYYCIQIL